MQSVVIQAAEAALDHTEMSQGWLHSQPAFGGWVEVWCRVKSVTKPPASIQAGCFKPLSAVTREGIRGVVALTNRVARQACKFSPGFSEARWY